MASLPRPDAGQCARAVAGRAAGRADRRITGRVAGPVRGSTAPVEVDEPTSDTDVTLDRPWIVIVWNDPINLMSYVVFVFQKLFGYSKEKATDLMLDVHHKGRAVVSNGPREKAELDVFRLHEHGLWATMQHDE
jgi:ATP-dependent Clp protease adaptor protein ClpS